MEMVALVILCVLAMAVIQHQKRSMERLVRVRENPARKKTRPRR